MQDLAPAGNLTQDFGYTPAGQTTGRGLIGDTIFLDRNGDNLQSTGEGIEGVTVRLYASTARQRRDRFTTVTDENGNYWFPNLPAGTFVVKVDTTTLPAGLTNTIDPDLTPGVTGDSQSTVTLAPGEINLDQDFGYDGAGTIGNLVWNDVNANGVQGCRRDRHRRRDGRPVLGRQRQRHRSMPTTSLSARPSLRAAARTASPTWASTTAAET